MPIRTGFYIGINNLAYLLTRIEDDKKSKHIYKENQAECTFYH